MPWNRPLNVQDVDVSSLTNPQSIAYFHLISTPRSQKTVIIADGKSVSLSVFKIGDTVNVTYGANNNLLRMEKIHVNEPTR